MKEIVAFDFDGTIIRGDSFRMMVRRATSMPRLLWALVAVAPRTILSHLHLMPRGRNKEKLLANILRGKTPDMVSAICRNLISDIENDVRPDMIAAIDNAKARGAEVVIVTASGGMWIRPWAEKRGIKVIATEMTHDEQLRWRYSTPPCVGAEKVRRFMVEYPDRKSYHLTVYADSPSDRPLIDIADTPHWVK